MQEAARSQLLWRWAVYSCILSHTKGTRGQCNKPKQQVSHKGTLHSLQVETLRSLHIKMLRNLHMELPRTCMQCRQECQQKY